MTNHLIHENSPYLLQHAENPVDWYPWGPEALEKANRESKPIFLSIGYAACHWCHVMAHESFEDPETAAYMNAHFVNIKVDREERPDLDNIYMEAVVAMTGQGGWPLSVFITPQGQPFYGGTYFPAARRYGMPAFRDVLASVVKAWNEERDALYSSGRQIVEHLQGPQVNTGKTEAEIRPQALEQAVMTLAKNYDWQNGGWGQAPKFPQPMVIDFLLRQVPRGDRLARDMAVHALQTMAQGGMYDVVGGGFARYSTDNRWLVPHFEKMLYDNALLARAYLHASLLGKEADEGSELAQAAPYFRQVCEDSLDFVLRELTDPEGGFYSSLDADSEGVEGKFYVWTLDEVRATLPDPAERDLFLAAYPVTVAGNFEGSNVLQRARRGEVLADQFHLPVEEVDARLRQATRRLLEARGKRVRPATDDKVLVSWNGLMLVTLAEAARYLSRPDYQAAAVKNAGFLLQALHPENRLLRSWRAGQANHKAYLEDYAALILGLLALYQTDPQPNWYDSATRLADEMLRLFADPQGGFFDTGQDAETLFARPKELQDNALPSGNSQAALALLHLNAFSSRGDWRDHAEIALQKIQPLMERYPTSFGNWLTSLDFALGPVREVALLAPGEDPQADTVLRELGAVLWARFRPRVVAAISGFPPPLQAAPLLQDRPLLKGKASAYVCENFSCKMPVNNPQQLAQQLDETRNQSSGSMTNSTGQ